MTKKMTTDDQAQRFVRECMGTFFIFQIQDRLSPLEAERMVDSATEILQWADSTFSLYKPQSETSKLRRGEISWAKASSEQLDVLKQCESWKKITNGYFDARSGSDYDPSGLVKVWAAARAADFLEANGIRDFTLNSGGDVYLSKDLTPGVLSRVGLSAPKSIRSAGAGANFIVDLAKTGFSAVATSGSAERGEHIWATASKQTFLQVSVIGSDYLAADIWATALVSGGVDALAHFEATTNRDELVAIAITRDGSLISTAGFTDLLVAL